MEFQMERHQNVWNKKETFRHQTGEMMGMKTEHEDENYFFLNTFSICVSARILANAYMRGRKTNNKP